MLGNFFNSNLIDTLHFNANSSIAYYFIDDLCVSIDSTLCSTWTGIAESDLYYGSIYPDPANDFLIIDFAKSENININIYDALGKLILSKRDLVDKLRIQTSCWKEGIYYISANSKLKIYNQKFIIIH